MKLFRAIILILALVITISLIIFSVHTIMDNRIQLVRLKPDDVRYKSFYKPGFWKNLVDTNKQSGDIKPFEVLEIINPIQTMHETVILTYSLFGTNKEAYFVPLKNCIIEFGNSLPPNWHFRVYICKECILWINELKEFNKVELYIMDDPVGGLSGTFWRFLILVEPENTIIIDSDLGFGLDKLINKRLDFFSSKTKEIASISHYPPFPANYHISADFLMKRAEAVLPYDESFIKNYPCRQFYGTDEVFTTIEVAPHWEKLPGGVIRFCKIL